MKCVWDKLGKKENLFLKFLCGCFFLHNRNNWSLLCNQLTEGKNIYQVARSVPCALLLPLQQFLTSDLVKPLFRNFGEECSAAKELLKAVSLLYLLNSTCRQYVCKTIIASTKTAPLYYVVFGSWETSIYIIVHNMSAKIILPPACKNGVVVVVSIFLRQLFFCHLVTKRNPVPTHQKDFCEKQCAFGTRFFQDLLIYYFLK